MNTASTLLIVAIAGSLLGCGKASAPAASDPAVPTAAEAPPPAARAETATSAPPTSMPETAAAAPETAAAAAPASAPPTSAAPATSAPTAAEPPVSTAASDAAAPAADLARGQQIYRQACAFCHDKGVAGAPKIGDAASWNARRAQGMDALYTAALRGKGAMPAKGGNPSLSDADVKASVDYLVAQSR